MGSFGQFVDKKTRAARKNLGVVERVLKTGGFDIKNHLEEEEPYLFLPSPTKRTSFGGIRIYKIGESIAYRVQKEEKTHPYGKAYRLDIKEMYDDLLSDDEMTEKKAAKEVIESVLKEFNKFFEKSCEADREMRDQDFDQQGDPLGRVMVRSTGTDYSNTLRNS
jgi:uncharacterized membrane-anchored protein YjiN (DUF445 family)